MAYLEESLTGVHAWWIGLADFGHEGEWVWQVGHLYLLLYWYCLCICICICVCIFGLPALATRESGFGRWVIFAQLLSFVDFCSSLTVRMQLS